MRYGNKRIILGSTPKMGTGTNIQDRLVALHHLDCPYRPSDIDNDVARLRVLKSSYDNQRYILEDNFTYKYPKLIKEKDLIYSLKKSMLFETYEIIIHGNLKYKAELGDSPHGNMVRIENIIKT